MTEPYADLLRSLPLLEALDAHELEMLQYHLRPRFFKETEVIFHEGDPARSCFIILSGKVGVYKQLTSTDEDSKNHTKVASLGSGALLGHMAIIDNKPRSATCRADEDNTLLFELGREEFDMLFSAKTTFSFKILDRVALDLVHNLRKTTALLGQAFEEKNRAKKRNKLLEASQASEGGSRP